MSSAACALAKSIRSRSVVVAVVVIAAEMNEALKSSFEGFFGESGKEL